MRAREMNSDPEIFRTRMWGRHLAADLEAIEVEIPDDAVGLDADGRPIFARRISIGGGIGAHAGVCAGGRASMTQRNPRREERAAKPRKAEESSEYFMREYDKLLARYRD